MTYDGVDAAQSGAIGDRESTQLETYVQGPGTVSFWWKVSSQQGGDQLRFYVNSAPKARIMGETDWEQQAISIPPGLTQLRWIYSKNGKKAGGQDTAWVDQVRYLPD